MTPAVKAFRQFVAAVKADHQLVLRNTTKYGSTRTSSTSLPRNVVEKIGLQMMVAVRVMRALEFAHVPVLPQIASRLIRHVYGAEIHWKAEIDPGVAVVHGCGLIISHAAKVGPGCILFQNVTLGESIDPVSREVGAPTLGQDVHIGPGATLLGPITVGDRTKIMAGAVLAHSVPADSLVRPAQSEVISRKSGSSASTDARPNSAIDPGLS